MQFNPPDCGQEALLVKLFADFLLARQRLLGALDPAANEPLKPALQSACRCWFELATEMLPGTPEDILLSLTENIVLNACRAACVLRESMEEEERDPADARIIRVISSQLRAE